MNQTEKNTLELDIEGMDCPACAMKIEKTVCKLDNISEVKVDLGSETASITFKNGNRNVDEIKNTISKLGYKAFDVFDSGEEDEIEKERKAATSNLKTKVITSIVLSVFIAVLSMRHHIGIHSLSDEFANWLSLPISTIVVFWCGWKFLRGFWIALKSRTSDMDTLISIGTLSAYVYSLAVMLFPSISGNDHSVYFESAAMIITFLLLGNYFEAKLKNKTHYAVKAMMGLQAKTATVIRNGNELQVPLKKVKIGDIVLVKPGERIPVDGKITEGSSSVDESMITGESFPVDKILSHYVIGGTTNLDGYLKIQTEKIGTDTFLSKIIGLVKNAQKSKPKIQRIADKVSSVFVPIVIVIAIATFVIWNFVINEPFSYSLLKAVSVLIIACPCALGLATPIAVVLGVGKAAENKILFNNAEAIENVSKVDTIVFDKTGTVTSGRFTVKEIISRDSKYKSDSLLKIAASIERYSEHPIGKSIVQAYLESGEKDYSEITNFKSSAGIGVEAKIDGNSYSLGSSAESSGKNIFIEENEKLIGEIHIEDEQKDNAGKIIQSLMSAGYEISLLSGDNEEVTKKIADGLGVKNFRYGVKPDEKLETIVSLQKENKFVAMVGDGINDAPALSKADIGIAIGTGQDIAIQSADVILVNGDLNRIPPLFQISKKTIRIIKQNIFWAFFYNAAAIPLAAGVLVPIGISITPVMASMFMALSDVVTVLGNSMRLKYMKLN